MAWQKYAAQAAASLLKSKSQKEDGGASIAAICCITMLPVILLVGMFTGANGELGASDPYTSAYNALSCQEEQYYQMEEVRFFDSYTYPTGESSLDATTLETRLRTDYFNISSFPSEDGTASNSCVLRSDDEILHILTTKYNVDERLNEEIIENLLQIRNGRAAFTMPNSDSSIISSFNYGNKTTGIELKSPQGSEVKSISEGTIVDITTSSDTYYVKEEVEEDAEEGKNTEPKISKKTKGLSVLIEHDVQKGINQEGEYDFVTMYSYYTNLSGVKWNVGSTISQGEVIGFNATDNIYFEIWDKDKKPVDPSLYMYVMSSADVIFPFEKDFAVTSEVGARDFDAFHYGLDMDAGYGASVHAIANGEVLNTNSTCGPNSGPTWCPSDPPVIGGGNYVAIKHEIDGKEYYTLYLHMQKPMVKVGDTVYAGQQIGIQGNSGNSYGSHLHLEIHTGGINTASQDGLINPRDLLPFEDK